MQRIIEKTLERNIPADELYTRHYYSRCRVFAISGYKKQLKEKVKLQPLNKSQLKAKARKDKKKGIKTDDSKIDIIEEEKDEPEDPGHVVYELFETSNVDFIPASIACVGKEDLCLSLFTTDKYYLREGYGTQLMSVLKNIYANQKLHLYVRIENKNAIDFYKANGWVEVEIKSNFYWETLDGGDALKMELQC